MKTLRSRKFLLDALIAVAVLAFSLGALAHGGFADGRTEASTRSAVVLAALAALPLVARRLAPLPVFAFVTAATATLYGFGYGLGPPVAFAIALYTVAERAGRPSTRACGRPSSRAASSSSSRPTSCGTASHRAPARHGRLGGGLVRRRPPRLRRERIAELEERARRAEREAERERRLAAAEERMRIARDLHDSAGHAISVILVQAGAARVLQERDPAGARVALETVEEVARDTLGEIDQLVRALRDDLPPGEVEPPPGLAALDALAERSRASGLDLTVASRDAAAAEPGRRPGRLPDPAGGAHERGVARARERRRGDRVRAELARDRRDQPGGARLARARRRRSRDRRHARAGQLLGGTLEAGADNGAFHLRARLPYGEGHERRPVRVLLVDDDDLMRAGLRRCSRATTRSRWSARPPTDAPRSSRCGRLRPDVVLMDVRMPDLDGISATREVLASSPEVKVLILTTFEQDDYIFGALNAGASGFLLKRTSPEELIAGIHTVAVGDSLLSPSVTRRVIDRMAQQPAPRQPYDERLERADAARAGGPGAGRARAVEHRDRGGALHRGVDREDAREADPHEAPPARPVQAVIFAYESGLTRAGTRSD